MLRNIWSKILRLDAGLEKFSGKAWVASRIAIIALALTIIFGAAIPLVSGWPGLSLWLKEVAAVAVISAVALSLALAFGGLAEWLSWQTHEFCRRLAQRWHDRGKPRLVVWENLDRLALVEKHFYEKAVKVNPGLKYPVVPGTLCFADPETNFWQLLTEEKPSYWLPEGVIGRMTDAEQIMKGCVVVRKPIHVPFSSFGAISQQEQKRLFPKVALAEARRRIHDCR